jgi:hypothetical protein
MVPQDINAALYSRLKTHNINVSEIAVHIIVTCIHAIEVDPEPAWRQRHPFPDLDALQQDIIAGITLDLSRFARSRGADVPLSEPVRTFPILHNLSIWIDRLCPFEKA